MTPTDRAPRPPRRALHGVLLIDKPLGWSSHDALLKVRRILLAEKAGHTGTLDPLATGVLPVCMGAATKFSQAGLEADKAYRGTLRFGQTRVGGDLEGAVVRERPVGTAQGPLYSAAVTILPCAFSLLAAAAGAAPPQPQVASAP